MSSELDAKRARAARFKAEAKKPPPPLPKNRMAHPGGKIVTTNKEAALAALLARKQAQGIDLTADQRRALAELNPSMNSITSSSNVELPSFAHQPMHVSAAPSTLQPSTRDTVTKAEPKLDADGQKRLKTLRKKLKDIEVLERRREEGAVLQANQLEKIAGKADLLAALQQLTGDV